MSKQSTIDKQSIHDALCVGAWCFCYKETLVWFC